MRTPDELHSMIDYLEQKDKAHPDIAVLRWILKEDQRPVDKETTAQMEAMQNNWKAAMSVMSEREATIADLREKLSRFVPGARS